MTSEARASAEPGALPRWTLALLLGAAGVAGLIASLSRPLPIGPVSLPGSIEADTSTSPATRGQEAVVVERAPAAGQLVPALIDVNTAGVDELQLLPGIGEVRARAIVRAREDDGPFGSVDELQRVSGIGPKTVERLRPLVRTGGD